MQVRRSIRPAMSRPRFIIPVAVRLYLQPMEDWAWADMICLLPKAVQHNGASPSIRGTLLILRGMIYTFLHRKNQLCWRMPWLAPTEAMDAVLKHIVLQKRPKASC